MHPCASPSLVDRFVLPLEGLYAAVAARFRSGVMTVAMIHLVCNRIRRAEQRVLRLLDLFLAGRLPAEAVPEGRARARAAREAGVAPLRIPRGFGWLVRMVPYVAAGYAGQLRLALAQPEMQALLAASPRARRALAPTCRMLMIEPEVLTPTVPEILPAPLEQDAPPVGFQAGSDGAVEPAVRLQPPLIDTC